MKPFAQLVVVLALIPLVGCSSAGQQDLETAKDRIRVLQREAEESERKLEELEQRLEALEKGGAASAPAPASGSPAPMPPPEPDPAVGPVTRIEIEEADLDAPQPPRKPPVPAATGAPTAATAPVTPEAQELYDRAYTFYHQGRYLDAETTFRQFLQGHGGTELADNAQYWIGECRWGRKDYEGAMEAFRETVERYPNGNKVPDALLKVGQSLEQMGDAEGAGLTYDEVVRRYPDSRASAVAADRKAALR